MFNSVYNPQGSIDRINSQIAELEKIKSQIPIMQQPITQNFQLANNTGIKFADNIEEVDKNFVLSDTAFFSKDMSVVWIKNNKNEIKTYLLEEIVQKDEKDILIESLKYQINELKKGQENAKSNINNDDEPVKNKKSSNVSATRTTKKK